MARSLRIQSPGDLYHFTSRGNARAPIFLNDRDRERFLAVLEDVKEIGGHLAIHYGTVSRMIKRVKRSMDDEPCGGAKSKT